MNSKTNVIAVLSVAAVLIAAVLWQTVGKSEKCTTNCTPTPTVTQATGTYTLVSALDFQAQITANPTVKVLDVRTAEEFATGKISSSINIDFNKTAEFTTYIEKLDKSQRYFVYCRSGNRSAQAVTQFKKLGFTNITELKGGINAWAVANLPVVK